MIVAHLVVSDIGDSAYRPCHRGRVLQAAREDISRWTNERDSV
jgi:hypothetical protein